MLITQCYANSIDYAQPGFLAHGNSRTITGSTVLNCSFHEFGLLYQLQLRFTKCRISMPGSCNWLPWSNAKMGTKTITSLSHLTHWGRVTHICVSTLTIIGSDNGLSPGRRQAIISTISGILLIRPLGTNFSELLIKIHTFSFKKIHLKMSSGKWRPFCLGLDKLTDWIMKSCNQYAECPSQWIFM